MAFQVATWFHADPRQYFGMLAGYLPDCQDTVSTNFNDRGKSKGKRQHVRSARPITRMMTDLSGFWYIRLVSARSSFFRLIRSLRPSASRLAAVILVCICSEVMSFDILKASP